MATPFNLRVKEQIFVFACQKKWVQTDAETRTFKAVLFTKMSKHINNVFTLVLNKLQQ